mgnify:CR=1 FL=1
MTSWQIVRVFAGLFILLSLALGVPGSPVFVSQWFLAFTAFAASAFFTGSVMPSIGDP